MINTIRAWQAGISVLAIMAASSGKVWAGPIVLVHDGTARAAIHVAAEVMADDQPPPADSGAAAAEMQRRRLRESVRDLSVYLERISGAVVPVVHGPPTDDAATLPVLVGRLADARFKPLSVRTEFRQGFRVVVSPLGIGLQGETDEAASYAIYELLDYYGTVWYRRKVDLPAIPEGRKVCLWVRATDGRCKVFVNGRHVPHPGPDGKEQAEAEGYCQPSSFDITSAVRPGVANSLAIACTRTAQNEFGTGGLLGPVVIGCRS